MSSTPPPEDESTQTEPASPRRLDERWWWSAALWIVVGGGVIAYQSGPIRDGSAFWLSWVMVAIGAAVAVRGVLKLREDWAVERERRASGEGAAGS